MIGSKWSQTVQVCDKQGGTAGITLVPDEDEGFFISIFKTFGIFCNEFLGYPMVKEGLQSCKAKWLRKVWKKPLIVHFSKRWV
jgi:hypothetical protein